MKMDLRAPCANCPFRTDVEPYLHPARAEEIVVAITEQDATFSCHKHNQFDDGEAIETRDSQHCAGALILLEKIERPNQWMRIAERMGWYDRDRLKMDSPVYDTPEDMIDAYDR
jgi:hypothetical protein